MSRGRTIAATTPATRADLPRFVAITFGVSWLLWLLPLLRSTAAPDLPEIVGLLGMFAPFGPAVAAFWLVRRDEGRAGARRLWRRGGQLGQDRRWLLPALLLVPAVAFVNLAVVQVLGGSVDWSVGIGPVAVVPVFLLILVGNAFPEEFGWRGYALDPLLERHGPIGASLVLGLVWGLWHLPLVFIEGTTQAAIPFHEFVIQTVLLALLYTWLHLRSGGSVLAAALLHASANTAGAAVPTWTTSLGRWTNAALLLAVVLVLVRRAGWSGRPQRAA